MTLNMERFVGGDAIQIDWSLRHGWHGVIRSITATAKEITVVVHGLVEGPIGSPSAWAASSREPMLFLRAMDLDYGDADEEGCIEVRSLTVGESLVLLPPGVDHGAVATILGTS